MTCIVQICPLLLGKMQNNIFCKFLWPVDVSFLSAQLVDCSVTAVMKLSLGSSWETPWALNFSGCRCWDPCLWHSLWLLLCWISRVMPGCQAPGTAPRCLSGGQSYKVRAVIDLQRPQFLGSLPLLPEIVTWPDVGSVTPSLEGGLQVVLLPKGTWVAKLQLHPLGPWFELFHKPVCCHSPQAFVATCSYVSKGFQPRSFISVGSCWQKRSFAWLYFSI